jgi:hypothetical protein
MAALTGILRQVLPPLTRLLIASLFEADLSHKGRGEVGALPQGDPFKQEQRDGRPSRG